MLTAEQLDMAAEIAAKLEERIAARFQVQPMLTLDQAAEALGISMEKARQMVQAGEIPYIRMDRLYRIKPADINAYLERHYTPAKRKNP